METPKFKPDTVPIWMAKREFKMAWMLPIFVFWFLCVCGMR